jgi:hypothetical protein
VLAETRAEIDFQKKGWTDIMNDLLLALAPDATTARPLLSRTFQPDDRSSAVRIVEAIKIGIGDTT